MKQAGADGLARVRRNNRAAAILVTQEVMAAFYAKNAEAPLFEGATRSEPVTRGVRLMPRRSPAGCQRYVVAFPIALNNDIELAWHWMCPRLLLSTACEPIEGRRAPPVANAFSFLIFFDDCMLLM